MHGQGLVSTRRRRLAKVWHPADFLGCHSQAGGGGEGGGSKGHSWGSSVQEHCRARGEVERTRGAGCSSIEVVQGPAKYWSHNQSDYLSGRSPAMVCNGTMTATEQVGRSADAVVLTFAAQ